MTDILRWVLVILSIPVLALLVLHTIRRARALADRVDEYREEQEAAAAQPGPINPYQDMGTVFGAPTPDEEQDHPDKQQ